MLGLRAKTAKGTYLVVFIDCAEIVGGCYATSDGIILKKLGSSESAQSAWSNAQNNWPNFSAEALLDEFAQLISDNENQISQRLVTTQPGFNIFADLLPA